MCPILACPSIEIQHSQGVTFWADIVSFAQKLGIAYDSLANQDFRNVTNPLLDNAKNYRNQVTTSNESLLLSPPCIQTNISTRRPDRPTGSFTISCTVLPVTAGQGPQRCSDCMSPPYGDQRAALLFNHPPVRGHIPTTNAHVGAPGMKHLSMDGTELVATRVMYTNNMVKSFVDIFVYIYIWSG
jgi:hypothetical protein